MYCATLLSYNLRNSYHIVSSMAIECGITWHRMVWFGMVWHRIKWNGMCPVKYPACIFVQLPVSHSTKTFKLNRLFGYLSHHRICTMFMFNECVFFSSSSFSFKSIRILCSLFFFRYLFDVFLVFVNSLKVEFRENKLSVNSRWRVTGARQLYTHRTIAVPI